MNGIKRGGQKQPISTSVMDLYTELNIWQQCTEDDIKSARNQFRDHDLNTYAINSTSLLGFTNMFQYTLSKYNKMLDDSD